MTITKIPLELTIDDSDGSVTIRLRSPQPDDDDANSTRPPQQGDFRPLAMRILEYLAIHPYSTSETIADALGSTTKNSVSTTLSALKKEAKVGNGGNGHTSWEWFAR